MSVPLAEALDNLGRQLGNIDTQFASKFNEFRNEVGALDKKMNADKEVFNSARKQEIPPALSGGNYYGRQYQRQVGGRLGATKYENEFAYNSGVSRYI